MRNLAIACTCFMLLFSVHARAQDRPVELTLQAAGLGIVSRGGEIPQFSFDVPSPFMALGIPVADRVSAEIGLGLSFVGADDFSLLTVSASLGFPLFLSSRQRGFFFTPAAALSFINADASGSGESDAQLGIGASLGTKFPVGNQISMVLEVPIGYWFESEWRTDAFSVGTAFGVSVFFN